MAKQTATKVTTATRRDIDAEIKKLIARVNQSHRKKKTKEPLPKYEDHVVCFMDLLGFRQRVERMVRNQARKEIAKLDSLMRTVLTQGVARQSPSVAPLPLAPAGERRYVSRARSSESDEPPHETELPILPAPGRLAARRVSAPALTHDQIVIEPARRIRRSRMSVFYMQARNDRAPQPLARTKLSSYRQGLAT